ncbi:MULTISPECIES: hypothetical protein [Bacillaceae]|nr:MULTISPECIES: hypothetical protein [Bacillaceae]
MFKMAFGINQTWLKNSGGTYVYSKVSNQMKQNPPSIGGFDHII